MKLSPHFVTLCIKKANKTKKLSLKPIVQKQKKGLKPNSNTMHYLRYNKLNLLILANQVMQIIKNPDKSGFFIAGP